MKKIYFIIILALFAIRAYPQTSCSFALDAGNDTTFCGQGNLQLNGSTSLVAPNLGTISWQPSGGLSDPSILTPTATVTGTTTYVLTVEAVDVELVFNGDFSLGDTGFTTMYVNGTGGASGPVSNPGDYVFDVNPNNAHIDFATFGDHTTGTGNMMIINGADIPNVNLWCQTIPVTPFSDYDFSVWATSCNWANPAVIRCTINGVPVGTDLVLLSDTGTWHQLAATWNSGSATVAEVCVIDVNLFSAGNDFAIDDVSFRGVCSQSDSVTVTVIPGASVSLGNDTSLCNNDTLIISVATAFSQYEWLLNGSPLPDTSSSLAVTQPGTYILNAASPGCSASDTINVTLSNINVELGNDTTICSGTPLNLFAAPGLGTYQWYANGSLLPDTSNNIIITSPATYTVIVSDASGCASADTITVGAEAVNVTVGSDTSICENDSVSIAATGTGGSYLWFLNQNSLGLTTPSISAFLPGTYSVTITSPGGCSASDSLSVAVNNLPVVQTINDTVLCDQGSIQLFTTGALTYQWTPALYLDDDLSAAPVSTPASAVTYTVTGTDAFGCINTDQVTISVSIAPQASFQPRIAYSCDGAEVSFENNSTDAQTFAWDFGDGSFSIEESPVHQYNTLQDVSVQLIAYNNGCTDTIVSDILLIPQSVSDSTYNVFTANGDGINDCFGPGSLNGLQDCFEIKIFSRWGKLVFESTSSQRCWNGKESNSGEELPQGVYFFVATLLDEELSGVVHLLR